MSKILPGSSEPQDLGSISYKDMTTSATDQQTQSVDSTSTVLLESIESSEKLLPEDSPEKQYEFATSFLKVGDYNTAERALKEFVQTNPNHQLAGNAQYWFAETFRIRQLYVDAASAYLEGYQKYPQSEKAPDNLLKLGVSLVQIGEKDQGCMMIVGLAKEYPDASQSILQKAKYEEKNLNAKKITPNSFNFKEILKDKKIFETYKVFERNIENLKTQRKLLYPFLAGLIVWLSVF